jgi:SAM-dependent methyltransferase
MAAVSIAQEVLGITDPRNPDLAMLEAHNTLTGESLTAEQFAAERARLDELATHEDEEGPLSDVERLLSYQALGELLITRQVSSATTLSSWVGYRRLLDRFGRRADGRGTALMIGSISALSSRSFKVFAHREYRVDRALIVDPQTGKDKRRHGTLINGSGLRLPLSDGSVDFVHTNSLLSFLRDPDVKPEEPQPTYRQMVRRLLAEISRVLTPGGQLFMHEVLPGIVEKSESGQGIDPEALDNEVKREANFLGLMLERAGLPRPFVGPPPRPASFDFLFQRKPSFDNMKLFVLPGTLGVYARKPNDFWAASGRK